MAEKCIYLSTESHNKNVFAMGFENLWFACCCWFFCAVENTTRHRESDTAMCNELWVLGRVLCCFFMYTFLSIANQQETTFLCNVLLLLGSSIRFCVGQQHNFSWSLYLSVGQSGPNPRVGNCHWGRTKASNNASASVVINVFQFSRSGWSFERVFFWEVLVCKTDTTIGAAWNFCLSTTDH
jgi:cyanate permease